MTKRAGLLCSTRLNLALISFLGCAIVYTLRSNLSFAVVCMVDSSADPLNSSQKEGISVPKPEECVRNATLFKSNENHEPKTIGEFHWAKNTQGTVLSAFFWGYMTSQVLGGYLASRIGSTKVIVAVVFLSSLATLLSPVAARFHVFAFVFLRVLLGFSQGAMFPAMHSMWAVWAPPFERSLLTGISYAGAQIGNVMVMPLSGFLCRYGMDGGWPSIFYSLGVIGLIWCVGWSVIAADSPRKHRRISKHEKNYIIDSLGETFSPSEIRAPKRIPFKAIITSPAVWACFVGHFAGDWGAYTMATSLPLFMNDVLGLDLTSMGLISSIPYLVYFAVINIGGFIADGLQHKRVLSTLNTRRMAMSIALIGQAFFLILIGYCGCGQELLVIILLTLSIGISGFQYSGFVVNYLDICPGQAGTVIGIGNTLSCFAGIFSPLITGWLTTTGSREEWQAVFLVAGIILVAGAVFFAVFASGEVQPWSVGISEEMSHADRADTIVKRNLSNTLPLIKSEKA
ncbi:major facilitator superfamily domain-containing protein [Ditylenchus destructor]|uniref:Sialin n=1 Tax=Ditylenchus destructor TaxID=166010 RepID=A0AAD4NIV7_9BILA|nr:major facilitator superfamily domain-containing protein [Ditylenchus destructor]